MSEKETTIRGHVVPVGDAVGIEIDIEAHFEFTVDQIWPDGDEPDEITAEDVAAVIRKSPSVSRWLNDWCMDNDLEVSVVVSRPNPHWAGDGVLFGDTPERFIRTVIDNPWGMTRRVPSSRAEPQGCPSPHGWEADG